MGENARERDLLLPDIGSCFTAKGRLSARKLSQAFEVRWRQAVHRNEVLRNSMVIEEMKCARLEGEVEVLREMLAQERERADRAHERMLSMGRRLGRYLDSEEEAARRGELKELARILNPHGHQQAFGSEGA